MTPATCSLFCNFQKQQHQQHFTTMPYVFGLDHRVIAFGSLALTSGVAVFSTYKWLSLRSRQQKDNVYESEKLLNEYLVFHYGSEDEILRFSFGPKGSLNFPKRCADLCLKHCKDLGVIIRTLTKVGHCDLDFNIHELHNNDNNNILLSIDIFVSLGFC